MRHAYICTRLCCRTCCHWHNRTQCRTPDPAYKRHTHCCHHNQYRFRHYCARHHSMGHYSWMDFEHCKLVFVSVLRHQDMAGRRRRAVAEWASICKDNKRNATIIPVFGRITGSSERMRVCILRTIACAYMRSKKGLACRGNVAGLPHLRLCQFCSQL